MPRIRPRGYGLHVRGTMLSCFRRETSRQFFIVKLGKKLPGQGEHLLRICFLLDSPICASLRWRAHCRLARQAILLSGSKGRSELSRGSGFLNRSFSHLVLASKTTHSSRSLTSPYAVCVVPPGTPAQVRSSKELREGHNVRTWMKNEPCRCSRARKEKTFYGKYGDERGDSTNQLSELRARGEGSGHVP